jgi:hypothetical protein
MTTATDERRRRGLTRLLSGVHGIWGLALLVRPRQVTDALAPELPDSRLWVARVLGARLVAQQALVLARPGPAVVRAAAAVDAVHAASMLPLLGSPRYRRAALISGGPAAAYAVLASLVAPRSERG